MQCDPGGNEGTERAPKMRKVDECERGNASGRRHLKDSYEVGWLCALPEELAAARAALDEDRGIIQHNNDGDHNTYAIGRIHEHNVVIACLPAGIYGTSTAATVALDMMRTFPQIRIGLLVGIGGGIPHLEKDIDIRLGDVVVSHPDRVYGGVIRYAKGKLQESKDGSGYSFVRKGSLDKPPPFLLGALNQLRARHDTDDSLIPVYLKEMLERKPKMKKTGYVFPGADQDRLFGRSDGTGDYTEIIRPPRDNCDPMVHYGSIASGDFVVGDANIRDALRNEHGAICVETEAAGLMDTFPCLVIRGICDYADSFKNDVWRRYAAAAAAAYAKEFLLYVSPQQVHQSQAAREVSDPKTHELLDQCARLQELALEHRHQRAKKSEMRDEDKDAQKCHQSFACCHYEQYKDDNPDKVLGTCNWVIDHPQFRAWRQSNYNNLLWISADPGCGKSVFSKHLVDHEFPDKTQTTVCYFFFKDNELQNSLAIALCALLHQLFTHQPQLIRYAILTWKAKGRWRQYEVREMWQIFLAATADATARPTVCVLDALDECREDDRSKLIGLLCDFYRRGPSNIPGRMLKFLVTGRPYDSVERWFDEITPGLPQIRLRGEDENDKIHQEINLVINQRVDKLAGEFRLSNESQELLRQRLLGMEHRTYLWLHLAMEEIRSTYAASPFPNKVQINSLPTSVDNAYERILQKIDPKAKATAQKILLIIVGARRPLSIGEMALALRAAESQESDSLPLQSPDKGVLENRIRKWCGLFVFIKHSKIFLIHQTAKEFLRANGSHTGPSTGGWKSSLTVAQAEYNMASLCIQYLCLSQLNRMSDERGQQYSDGAADKPQEARPPTKAEHGGFFKYCAEHWVSHLDDQAVVEDEKLLSKVLSLYDTRSNLCLSWFHVSREASTFQITPGLDQHVLAFTGHAVVLDRLHKRQSFDIEAKDRNGMTALSWAAKRGNEAVAKWLLDAGADANVRDGSYSTALQQASQCGHEKIVQILLDAGVNVNAQGEDTALQRASANGHEMIVQMLLNAGADVKGNNDTALQGASANGHEKIVQILLDAGANVNAQGGSNDTALKGASYYGHVKIVRMLLKAGADVNARRGNYGTALQRASAKGHKEIVRVLLDARADANAQGGNYGTALQRASANGYEMIVQMLLNAGADVNAQGGNNDTALQRASYYGHMKIVRMLLKAGADVNAQMKGRGAAVYAASTKGHVEIVHVLLNAGADVNARGGLYYTALRGASANGYLMIAKMLLNAGADVNAQKPRHGTALQEASTNGYLMIVQMLLNAGADVNARGGNYGTALQGASAYGCEAIVQILLNAGANVNARGGIYSTALQGASASGHKEIVQMLLDSGANVNAQGGLYRTAVYAASTKGYEMIVQILLDAGADVDVERPRFGTALQAASAIGHKKLVQMLLKAGADVNAQRGYYGTALQAALEYGSGSVVQILLDAGADANAQGGNHGTSLCVASRSG